MSFVTITNVAHLSIMNASTAFISSAADTGKIILSEQCEKSVLQPVLFITVYSANSTVTV